MNNYNENKIKENPIWTITSDGWFTFYRCKNCGFKYKLTIDTKILPDHCPVCKKGEI